MFCLSLKESKGGHVSMQIPITLCFKATQLLQATLNYIDNTNNYLKLALKSGNYGIAAVKQGNKGRMESKTKPPHNQNPGKNAKNTDFTRKSFQNASGFRFQNASGAIFQNRSGRIPK